MNRYRKIILLSLKIGIGSSLSLYTAQELGLNYAVSAGTVTLLSLMNSKWETIRLSGSRIASFLITVLAGWILFTNISSMWIAYGILLTFIVFMAELLEWRATISVNGVIAAHLVTYEKFNDMAVWNELIIVIVGVGFAILFNLFNGNYGHKKHIVKKTGYIENRMQMIIGAMSAYLSNKKMETDVWQNIKKLEEDIQDCIKEAYEYQNNTFYSHPEYYISYFVMRKNQCQILHNLHYEMKKMRTMPKNAKIAADYLLNLAENITEYNNPEEQLSSLKEIIEHIKCDELPTTMEEFESSALLFHILMDIEDLLVYKKHFIDNVDKIQKKHYWKAG